MSAVETASSALAVLAFLYLAVISVVLWVIDAGTHRLPNRIVLPGYAVGVGLLGIATALGGDPQRLGRALLGMGALFAGYFILRMASPTSIGGGDVKLAGLLGLYLGWLGWSGLVIATAAAFLIGGVHALVLLARRRATRSTRIPFGPAMIGGAWLAIVLSVLPLGSLTVVSA
ncbi:prepilin peptidase [Microbacterium pygmaeum]|uniref:Type IV leader peptidase family protein n=1 Tax=Microbacterium pygmaeum TaxID=370764 RepID=A0A1G8BIR8_9MICO|nr:prepilin peptidase [Microbacterium pygmaeum]SDH33058.1 Type IV leader peptidase family protein [Microbacterium pygmaeum]